MIDQEFKNWIDWVPGGACIINSDYQVVAWNQTLATWTGIDTENALGMALTEEFPHLQSPRYLDRLGEVFKTGNPAIYSAGLHRNFFPVELNKGGKKYQMTQQTYARRIQVEPRLVLIYVENHTGQHMRLAQLRDEVEKRLEFERELQANYDLQRLTSELQSEFMKTHNSKRFFQRLIDQLTDFTQSEIGFITEVVRKEGQVPELVVQSVSNRSSDPTVAQFFKRFASESVTFRGSTEIFGGILQEKKSTIERLPLSRYQGGAIPEDHPVIESFLGLPIILDDHVIGVVGLANSKKEYEAELQESLKPHLMTCAEMMRARDIELQRIESKEALIRETRKLEEANLKAEQAVRTKAEFLANMSHEIRTPMTAILGYSDILSEGTLSPKESEEAIDSIQRNSDHLLTIINDILDLSKLEANRLNLDSIPLSPRDLVYEVRQMMAFRAQEKKIDLLVDVEDSVASLIQGDPTRLRQILVNLVGNAIKFTEKGHVSICVKTVEVEGHQFLDFAVNDTGMGISEDKLDEIFQAFSQEDSSITRKFGGTGLGLAISQRLARMMGGQIIVTSQKDVGSTFTARIEAAPLQTKPHTEEVESVITPKEIIPKPECVVKTRVLLVDDSLDNRKLVSFLLRKLGFECDEAVNGADAVDKVMTEMKQGTAYPIVFMDMQMPVMDGMTALKTLRANGYTLPVIALTANAMPEDREMCLEAGFDDYVSKPVRIPELKAAVDRWGRVVGLESAML